MARKGILKLNILIATLGLAGLSLFLASAIIKSSEAPETEEEVRVFEDTKAPQGLIKPLAMYLGEELPAASCLVQDVSDESGRVYISYNEVPDVSTPGIVNAGICLEDIYGNRSYLKTPVTVIDDHTAPLIYGPKDINLDYGDEGFDFMEGIYSTDDYDAEPSLRCDTSELDIYEPGEYTLRYFASDDAGNCRITSVTVTVGRPEDGDMDTYLKGLVNDIYKEIKCRYPIWTARAIFNYVHDNMTYDPASCGTGDIEEAAYYGFTNHKGNCYVYYCMCKVLLDRAGITNMSIVRYPAEPSGHYWILIRYRGYWWHCDATPFKNHDGVYFMLADHQLDEYHHFDRSAYPARSPSGSNLAIGAVYGQTDWMNGPAATPAPEQQTVQETEPVTEEITETTIETETTQETEETTTQTAPTETTETTAQATEPSETTEESTQDVNP